jgi:sulfur carrier protein
MGKLLLGMLKDHPACYARIMSLSLQINGQNRVFAALNSPVMLGPLIGEMGLKGDRIAVEHNGEIAPKVRWGEIPVSSGDRLEVVHFVGGGGGRDMAPLWGETGGIVRCLNRERGSKSEMRGVGVEVALTIHNICYQTLQGMQQLGAADGLRYRKTY